jgi:putative ABC transport system ATP-binding protein
LDVRGVGATAARKRAEELLGEVGLTQKTKSFPADLSGGQKQRVAIARALAGDPPILLADEPTAALDSTSGRAVIELLQRLARVHGRAVVMVTHDPRVLLFGDRIIHLEDGRIAREETQVANETETSSLFEEPGQTKVAQEIQFGV